MNNRHLSYRSSNPALNSDTFKNVVKKDSLHLNETMTIRGTVDKTALALSLLLISGYYCYFLGEQSLTLILTFIGFFLGLILFFTTISKGEIVIIFAFEIFLTIFSKENLFIKKP